MARPEVEALCKEGPIADPPIRPFDEACPARTPSGTPSGAPWVCAALTPSGAPKGVATCPPGAPEGA
jgi:hypothetical protein